MIAFLIFLSLPFISAEATPLLPSELSLPSQIGKRTKEQIQSVFSSLENTYQSHQNALWWLKFQKALVFKEKEEAIFCKEMRDLSQEKDFPLHPLALISSYSLCPFPSPLRFSPKDFSPWLRLRLARTFYKRGKKLQNHKHTLDAAEYLGKHEEAKETRVSYLKHATWLAREEQDTRLASLQAELYKLAPRFNPHPKFEDYLSIAHDYRLARDFQKAFYFYRKILNSGKASFEEKNSCFKWLRWMYKNQRNRKGYLKASNQWSQFLKNQKTPTALEAYHKNKLQLARDYWNLDQNEKSLEVLNQIPSSLPSRKIRSQAYWLKALIKEQEGKWKESLKELDQILALFKIKKNISPFLESVLWRKAWILRQDEQKKSALTVFTTLLRTTKSPYLKARVLYWKGETQWDLNQKVAGIKTFNRIIREDPFGYYGLLAHRRLGKTPDFHTNIIDNLSNVVTNINLNQEALETIRWLNVLNEKELSTWFLRFQEKNLFRRKRKRRSDWLSYLSLQRAARNYFNVFQMMGNLEPHLKKYFLKNHTALFFPIEYETEIKAAIKKHNLSKALVFSLIRQESAFNPRARSSSDAFGLMQLIPSTARAMARRIKKPYRGIRDLYHPNKNIRLGTYYLKHLFKKYDNSFILAVAAYNAGETQTRKWRATLSTTNPLEFIENITYEETRTYVRLLIRNFIFYNKILNEDKEFFPEWLLHLN